MVCLWLLLFCGWHQLLICKNWYRQNLCYFKISAIHQIGREIENFDMMFSYSYNWRDDDSSDGEVVINFNPTEETPLITEVNNDQVEGTSVSNITSIVLLVTALLGGLCIGVYLLVLQYNEEHILPPVEMPARHVNKSEWDQPSLTVIPSQPFHADTVIIEETGTRECSSLESCVPLLREIKATFGVNDSLPYNFLVSSDGTAYEGLGWSRLAPIQSELKPLDLAFIGNFSNVAPPIEEVVMAEYLIREFLKKDLLVKNYTIRGDLYDKFKDYPQWKDIRSGFLNTL